MRIPTGCCIGEWPLRIAQACTNAPTSVEHHSTLKVFDRIDWKRAIDYFRWEIDHRPVHLGSFPRWECSTFQFNPGPISGAPQIILPQIPGHFPGGLLTSSKSLPVWPGKELVPLVVIMWKAIFPGSFPSKIQYFTGKYLISLSHCDMDQCNGLSFLVLWWLVELTPWPPSGPTRGGGNEHINYV